MRTIAHDTYGNPTMMTYGVQMLIFINIGIYLVERLFGIPLERLGELHANWWTHLAFWQLITYQFLHQNFWHIFFNMLGLYFLGPETERGLGTNRFFALYFLSGILGGIGWSLLAASPYEACVGASGAVFGVLGAYAALYPNNMLYIYGILPVKAWILILVLVAYELLRTLHPATGRYEIANAAHLAGGIAGYLYALIIGRPDILHRIQRKLTPPEKPPVSRAEIDRILDKAAQHGMHTLTKTERELLKRAGRQ